MRRSDKILFDTAKERVQKSKLDDHSKEGLCVALEMSGEACNGMEPEKKQEALTQAVFSLTLAVSYFMSQAPEHTIKCVNDAIDGHVGNCAKLIAEQKAAKKPMSGESISLSFKEGLKATGKAAIITAVVAAAVMVVIGFVWWQNSKTRDEFVNILKKNGITQHSQNNTKE